MGRLLEVVVGGRRARHVLVDRSRLSSFVVHSELFQTRPQFAALPPTTTDSTHERRRIGVGDVEGTSFGFEGPTTCSVRHGQLVQGTTLGRMMELSSVYCSPSSFALDHRHLDVVRDSRHGFLEV